MGHDVRQSLIDPLHPPGQGAGELAGGLAGGRGGFSVDEVDDRLGLGQVQLAVEEGPLGELPRPGRPGPSGIQSLQDQGEDHGGAVALQLRCLLPGVAVGGPADKGQAGVQHLARLVGHGAVEQVAVGCSGQGLGPFGAKDPLGGLDGSWA